MQIFASCGPATVPLSVSADSTFTELEQRLSETLSLLPAEQAVWFQHRGRRCREEQTLAKAGLQDGSWVQVHLRLRGGGGDGGATGAESRSSYLEMYMKKKPDKVNPAEEKLARWTTCKLSGEKLEPPCVVDELGSLYNKDAVVSALVSKSMPKALAHISSLKHVTDVKLTQNGNAAISLESTATNFQPGNEAAFCCPISGQPLNGQYRFCVVLPSGYVISEKAIKSVPSAVEELVGGKWSEALPLNGTQSEVEALWDSLIAKRAATKRTKKDKRKADRAVTADENAAAAGVDAAGRSSSGDSPSDKPTGRPAKRQVQDFTIRENATVKRVKAADLAPAHADKKVWASLFTSSHGPQALETYSCRSTSARGWV